MSEPSPLTPDEDLVFREFLRLDVEPNQIPPELYAGFIEELSRSVNLPLDHVRVATQGLIDKGIFDSGEVGEEGQIHNEREILRDLLLHDPEVQDLLKNIVAELCAKKN
jgi:hypothetical protein